MAGSGKYTISLTAMLDDSVVRKKIAALQAEVNKGAIGAAGNVKGGKSATAVMGQTAKGAKQATKEVNKMSKGLSVAGMNILDVGKKVAAFGAVTSVIQGVGSGISSVVQNVTDLDAQLTEFKKVSDLSGKALQNYTDKAYAAGRETARTGVEMLEASTNFRKMGYDDQQSLQLAEVATKFQNIADTEISAGEAASFINSQIKAFNFDAENSIDIIDKVNEVANKNAVGTNDLQLALTKAGSAMGVMGNTYEETIGMVTAGTEIMVGQPAKVGRGLK